VFTVRLPGSADGHRQTWRIETTNSSEKNCEQVIEKMAAAARCQRTSVSGRMIVMALRIAGNQANKFGPRLQSAKARHGESAPNEKLRKFDTKGLAT
jgi:hypothetical protein